MQMSGRTHGTLVVVMRDIKGRPPTTETGSYRMHTISKRAGSKFKEKRSGEKKKKSHSIDGRVI